QLRARHRAGGRDDRPGARGYPAGHRDRLHRRDPGCGQRCRWLCRDRAHAADVQVEQGQEGLMTMELHTLLEYGAKASYLLAALLFILGIKAMSSPVTARAGIKWAGVGMVIATV